MDATKTVSPKVKASAWMTLAVTLGGTVLAAVTTWAGGLTPEDVPMLGVWALPAITLFMGVLNVLAGYLKRDPLREEVVQAVLAPVPSLDVDPTVRPPAAKAPDITVNPGGPYATD